MCGSYHNVLRERPILWIRSNIRILALDRTPGFWMCFFLFWEHNPISWGCRVGIFGIASGHLHESTNFGIDLTNILSLIINIIPNLMPSFWITFFYWVMIVNSNHYKPKMEGCDAKQNATFIYVFFFPRMNRFVPPTIPPTNIVFRMQRWFSIDMAFFSPSISVILHAIPLLWILKWFNTLHQWMNILHLWMNIPFLSIFITLWLYNLCSPIFSAVVLQESVEDLDLRCLELLQLLRDLPQRHLAVVSHTGGWIFWKLVTQNEGDKKPQPGGTPRMDGL